MLDGFKKVDVQTTKPNRLICNIQGQEKTGKTHFSLTAPGPIAFFDLDCGTEGVIHKFANEKEIFVKAYAFDENQNEAKKLWDVFCRDYNAALAHPAIRTIVIDSGSDMWEFIRMAEFGKLIQVPPLKYREVNSDLRKMVRAVLTTDKSLIITHKLKMEYDSNNRPTGKYSMSGFSEIPYLVQANLETFINEDGAGIRIVDCRAGIDFRGMEFPASSVSFDTIMELVSS
jgi:hypothetical protein